MKSTTFVLCVVAFLSTVYAHHMELYLTRAEQCREFPDIPVTFSDVTYNPAQEGSSQRTFSANYEVTESFGDGQDNYDAANLAGQLVITIRSCEEEDEDGHTRHGEHCTAYTTYQTNKKCQNTRLTGGNDKPLAFAWARDNGCFEKTGEFQVNNVHITESSLPGIQNQPHKFVEINYQYLQNNGDVYMCLHVHAQRKAVGSS